MALLKRKKDRPPPEDRALPRDFLGFLGEGSSLVGDLVLEGGFRVDGRVTGRICSPSTLIVGPPGKVDTEELRVKTLSVSGLVSGRLIVQDRLEIHRGGRVCGAVTLSAPGFVMEQGGYFEGTVEIATGGQEPEAVHEPASLTLRKTL